MSKQTINIGASPNDGTGTPLRTSFDYTNQNFTELYTALGGGVGLPGATTQVIFNDGGTNLAGDAGLVYNKTTDALTVAGLVTAGSATITGAATVGTTLGVTGVSTLTGNAFANGSATVAAGTPGAFANAALTINNRGGVSDLSLIALGYRPNGTVLNGAAYIGFITTSGSGNVLGDLIFGTRSVTTDTAPTERYRIDSTGISTWSVAGTTAMTLNSTGLGIGVVPSAWYSPYSVLQVGIGASISSFNSTYYDNIQLACNYFANSSGADRYINNGYATQYFQYNGSHIFRIAGNNTSGANQALTWTQAMTLDASGNLLVASGVIRAAGRTQIGSGYIGDISGTGNNIGVFFGSTGLLPANGSGTTSDNTSDLGSATARWDTVFAGTGTINTSDRNEKQDISDLSASEKRVASSIKQLVKKYRFKDAVASKGENARIHVGWIAQDIQSAFAAEGLDASDYGMFCSDTWEENGVEKTRLGLRYDEVLAFVVSAI
jgi:hypothetical protein